MTTTKFSPLLSVLAFAGNSAAAFEACASDLTRSAGFWLKDGNKRNLTDTHTALTGADALGDVSSMTPAQRKQASAHAARVADMVTSIVNACDTTFALHGVKHADPIGAAASIVLDATAAYEAVCAASGAEAAKASTERKVKAAATKAAKEKQAAADKRAADKAAKDTAGAFVPLTVGRAIEFLRAALAAGSDEAFAGLESMVNEFTEVSQVTEAV